MGEREIPYSIAAATARADARDELRRTPRGALLNQWAADDLGARPGDPIALTYFVEGAAGGLDEETTTLTVAGFVAMDDPDVDTGIVPEFPGIAKAESIGEWDPPFPLDLGRIRPEDEDYWDRWRAAPKAFVSFETAWTLWGRRYGTAMSVVGDRFPMA